VTRVLDDVALASSRLVPDDGILGFGLGLQKTFCTLSFGPRIQT